MISLEFFPTVFLLIRKRLFDSQTDRLIKSSLLMHASTRGGFWPDIHPAGGHRWWSWHYAISGWTGFKFKHPRFEISNIQFMLANPFCIYTVKQLCVFPDISKETLTRKKTDQIFIRQNCFKNCTQFKNSVSLCVRRIWTCLDVHWNSPWAKRQQSI